MAVGEARGSTEYTDTAMLAPAQDAVIGDVADIETIVVGEPHGSFEPAVALAERLQRGIGQHHGPESLIVNLNVLHGAMRRDKARGKNRHATAQSSAPRARSR